MIIGNNNNIPSFNTNFDQRFNTVKENAMKNKDSIGPMNESPSTMIHSDVTSKSEMNEKAFAMLQERLRNGLITVEEFNRKVNELNRRR